MESLIAADNHILLLAAMFGLVVLGFGIDKTKIGKAVSGVIWVIFGGTLLSNLNIIPDSAPLYDLIWDMGVPVAVSLLLFNAHLGRIVRESGRVLIGFSGGAVGAAVGALIGFFALPLGPDGASLAGMFAGTYIGGSMNFAAVAQATGFDDSNAMSAAVAADNIAGTLFIAVLAAMPAMAFMKRYFVIASDASRDGEAEPNKPHMIGGAGSMALALFIAFAIVAASHIVAGALGVPKYSILFVTGFTLILASVFPNQMGKMASAFDLGLIIMYLFFIVIGAGADVMAMLDKGLVLFAFAAIVIGVHFIFLLITGKIAKLEVAEMVIASNACILGPATAAAQAGAMGWRGLVTPAILVGIFGYAIGTFIGTGLAAILN